MSKIVKSMQSCSNSHLPYHCLFYFLARALDAWRGVWICMRSSDAQYQWARTCAPVIKKITSLFSWDFESVSAYNTWLQKFRPLIFIQRPFTLSVSFGFHDPPLLTFKADRLDLRWLDPGKVTSKTHQLNISACERSLLDMQSASLKV